MSTYYHEMTIAASLESVWEFIRLYDQWGTTIPGYIKHDIINERESIWNFMMEFGIFKRKMNWHMEITEWRKQEKLCFRFKEANEKVIGHGSITMKKITREQTKIIAFLEMAADGGLLKIIKPFYKNNRTELMKEFEEILKERIAQYIEKY